MRNDEERQTDFGTHAVMTTTTQPDRQNGDGLLPCPLCLSNAIERGVCYAGDSKEKEPAVLCAKCGCRATLKAWNTRATLQPARDGAEGAGEWQLVPKEPTSEMVVAAPHHSRVRETWRRMLAEAPAPPKPAPDAMRELADQLIGIQEDLPNEDDRNALGMAAHYLRKSAPVPPADGANEPKSIPRFDPNPHTFNPNDAGFSLAEPDPESLYRDIFAEITAKAKPVTDPASDDPERVRHYVLPVGPLHRAAGKLGFQMFNGEQHLADAVNEIARLKALPSGTGAAEPEPVGEIQRQFYEWWEANQVDPAHGMITQNCALATWHGAYNKYVRGRPVQSGADERPRWRHKKRGTFYTEIGRGELQTMDAGGLTDGEPMVIYQGDDGKIWVRDAVEFEDGRFEFVPPSRQTPPSSSERIRTAPENCPQCFDESDCSSIDVCRAVATTDASPKGDGK